MRRLAFAPLLLLPLALPAAAPPAVPPADAARLIEQLASEDHATRQLAMRRLVELGEEALPALEAVRDRAGDPDVRLRAAAVAGEIRGAGRGFIRAMGPGASLKSRPPYGGYWFNRVQFTPDGKYAVTGGGALILIDLAAGREVRRVLEVGGARPALAVSRDGRYALTGHANDLAFHLVEIPSLRTARAFRGGHTTGIAAVALSADNALAASWSPDGTIGIWDVKTAKRLHLLKGERTHSGALAFTPDGKQLFTACAADGAEGFFRVIDVKTGKLLRQLRGQGTAGTAAAFDPALKTAACCDARGTVSLWDLASGKVVRQLHHRGAVNQVAFSPDGRRLLSAGYEDSLVKLWEVRSGKQIDTFEGHLGGVLGVAFSRDGKLALSCDKVATVRLWRAGK